MSRLSPTQEVVAMFLIGGGLAFVLVFSLQILGVL